MKTLLAKFKYAVATLAMIAGPYGAAASGEDLPDRITELLETLRQAGPDSVARVERDVVFEWSKSGSPAMDLLLSRGRAALEVSDIPLAIAHFTALTDHAPDFAEGWHGLALSYVRADALGPAVDALQRTLTLNPHHFQALRGVGVILELTGKPDLAQRAYHAALDIRPHDDEVAEALARLAPQLRGAPL
ncbi:MAG: tetratricopeptide repeat protein [Paracoccaceae bacterium]